MKSLINFNFRSGYLRNYLFFQFFLGLIVFNMSCTVKHEPYSVLEFTGEDLEYVSNYSKTGVLMFGESDSLSPVTVPGSINDLIALGDKHIFVCTDTTSPKRYSIEYIDDSALYVNNKIYFVDIPDNDKMIPWFKNLKGRDLSALQFIGFSSEIPEGYLSYFEELAEIKPYTNLYYQGDFKDLAGLLKIFKPQYIIGPSLSRGDYDMLAELKGLEILMISLKDTVIKDPLPFLPRLNQLLLTELGSNDFITNEFLVSNKQIERIFIQKSGRLDFSVLSPLKNLKELVVIESDTILNPELINNHNKLELLSLPGDEPYYNPALIQLPFLRWMTFSSKVTQEEFGSFIDAHPNLEVVEVLANEKITDLQPLSKLGNLYGLIVTDTVTDIGSIKNLTGLRYLSLPLDFLDENKADIRLALPGTRIAANQGFCLGSGWLLLLIPLILIMRFFTGKQNKSFRVQ
ncbi:MAG: hypothetical protein IQL11_09485 [Bacteroidales bacterium]|nr:hypothetical protein [Bacteroidales bacterium]